MSWNESGKLYVATVNMARHYSPNDTSNSSFYSGNLTNIYISFRYYIVLPTNFKKAVKIPLLLIDLVFSAIGSDRILVHVWRVAIHNGSYEAILDKSFMYVSFSVAK